MAIRGSVGNGFCMFRYQTATYEGESWSDKYSDWKTTVFQIPVSTTRIYPYEVYDGWYEKYYDIAMSNTEHITMCENDFEHNCLVI